MAHRLGGRSPDCILYPIRQSTSPTVSLDYSMSVRLRTLIVVALLALPGSLLAQRAPGRPIGKVTTIGNLIHIEMDADAVTPARLFDLDHRTLRYTPDGSGYRVENAALVWDAEFGTQ